MNLPDFLSPAPYEEFKGHCVFTPKECWEEPLTGTRFWLCSCGEKIRLSLIDLSMSNPWDAVQRAYSDHWDRAFYAFRLQRKWGGIDKMPSPG